MPTERKDSKYWELKYNESQKRLKHYRNRIHEIWEYLKDKDHDNQLCDVCIEANARLGATMLKWFMEEEG